MGIGDISNTGMQAAMSNMEVTSNNIANANTIGFKKSYINFSDLFPSANGAAANQIGMGVNVASVLQNFSNGSYLNSGQATDISINNSGFFILKDASSGQVSYTRAGRFVNQGNYLVVGNQRLQGFQAVNNAIPAGANVNDIQISTSSIPATSSTTASMNLNLNAKDAIPSVTPFDPNNQSTYNYQAQAPYFYDSLGGSHTVTTYYVKTATPGTWDVQVYVDGNSAGPAGTASFSNTGVLTGTTGLTSATLSFTPGNGAKTPQAFTVSLTGSTSLELADNTNSTSADGNLPGNYTIPSIDKDGNVYMNYDNGQKVLAGQIALANFQSPQSLTDIGNMQWVATTGSGNATINPSSSANNISVGSVELSNVDLTTEMVNLISAQHTFQANAQVEQTYNEIMNTVIKL